LLQNTPTLFPPNAMIEEMSSVLTVAAPGSWIGVAFQFVSPPTVWLIQMWPPASHVAQSRPVESLAMTSVSVLTELMVFGKPVSTEYVSVFVS
jgi:hypothetical protein